MPAELTRQQHSAMRGKVCIPCACERRHEPRGRPVRPAHDHPRQPALRRCSPLTVTGGRPNAGAGARRSRSDRAELARMVGLTRARVTRILDLLLLTSDIEEEVLAMSLSSSCSCVPIATSTAGMCARRAKRPAPTSPSSVARLRLARQLRRASRNVPCFG